MVRIQNQNRNRDWKILMKNHLMLLSVVCMKSLSLFLDNVSWAFKCRRKGFGRVYMQWFRKLLTKTAIFGIVIKSMILNSCALSHLFILILLSNLLINMVPKIESLFTQLLNIYLVNLEKAKYSATITSVNLLQMKTINLCLTVSID